MLRPGQSLEPLLTEADHAAKEAEMRAAARGDAQAAREHHMSGAIVEESLQHHQLQELADLGDAAPGWMYSRWCVDQAYRWMLLTKDPRTDDMVRLVLAATHWDHLDRVVGDPVALTEYGTLVAATDSLVQQLCVYSEGGLRDYLDVCAEAGLLARADRIEEWAEAPLGVFRLQGRRGPALALRDVVHGAATEVLDLGAFREQPSSVVLGRVVPISDPPYRLFDSRPVPLDEETAHELAAALRGHDRLGWLWALARAREAGRLERGFSCRGQTLYSTDVPPRFPPEV